ncbi:hypothetical protein Ahy_A09g044948 [Arachis hypogaea]|uniref:Protein FAR1-RELATED SEQUENCE n=1 Tax=Arachis hypogaea TaxID=3818 RepID=A0A445BL61_ARAHY|nr:hypothetical protein Ahy_A09g044948 [Arachis hypogaea]
MCTLTKSSGKSKHNSEGIINFQLNTQQVCGYIQISSSPMSPRYILERWSKNVKRRHTHQEQLRRATIEAKKQENICKFVSESEELTAILHRAYDNVVVEMQELKAKRKGTYSLSHKDANLESVNELHSPPKMRTRGRPKNRLGSKLDKQIVNASEKKKTKALSELNLFYGASVVQPNSNQYHGHVMNYQFMDPVAGDKVLDVAVCVRN